jgi:hypothetical protein
MKQTKATEPTLEQLSAWSPLVPPARAEYEWAIENAGDPTIGPLISLIEHEYTRLREQARDEWMDARLEQEYEATVKIRVRHDNPDDARALARDLVRTRFATVVGFQAV